MFELTEKDRIRLSGFIEEHFGIQMPPEKKILLQSRLQKRAAELKYESLHAYIDYIFSETGQANELDLFSTIISTHKTEFFREDDHFTTLKNELLPALTGEGRIGTSETLVVWSCASSTGEEIYSIAITLYEYFRDGSAVPPLFKVIGTDISEHIAAFARKGIYDSRMASSIPPEYQRYIMRSKDSARHAIRIVPEVRYHTDFRRQNLMDAQYRVKKGIHIIFCRNVLIYFNKQTQEMILRRLISFLAPGGFLIIGHSESLTGINLPLNPVKLTVYQKTEDGQ